MSIEVVKISHPPDGFCNCRSIEEHRAREMTVTLAKYCEQLQRSNAELTEQVTDLKANIIELEKLLDATESCRCREKYDP